MNDTINIPYWSLHMTMLRWHIEFDDHISTGLRVIMKNVLNKIKVCRKLSRCDVISDLSISDVKLKLSWVFGILKLTKF